MGNQSPFGEISMVGGDSKAFETATPRVTLKQMKMTKKVRIQSPPLTPLLSPGTKPVGAPTKSDEILYTSFSTILVSPLAATTAAKLAKHKEEVGELKAKLQQ